METINVLELINSVCKDVKIEYYWCEDSLLYYIINFKRCEKEQTLKIDRNEVANASPSIIRKYIHDSVYALFNKLGEVDKQTDEFKRFLLRDIRTGADILTIKLDGDVIMHRGRKYYVNFRDKDIEEITEEKINKMDIEWSEIRKKLSEKQIQFELGKYYQHSTGSKLYIIGVAKTIHHGTCFIGETELGELVPAGMDKDSTFNWSEILKEEFINNKKKG